MYRTRLSKAIVGDSLVYCACAAEVTLSDSPPTSEQAMRQAGAQPDSDFCLSETGPLPKGLIIEVV
jgi:hypothetical protein